MFALWVRNSRPFRRQRTRQRSRWRIRWLAAGYDPPQESANSTHFDKRTIDKRGPARRATGLRGDHFSGRHWRQETM